MESCEQIQNQIAFYLDDELHKDEIARLEAHLKTCVECHARFEQERQWLNTIRAIRPLYKTPLNLRHQIEQHLFNEPSESHIASSKLRRRIQNSLLPTSPTLSFNHWVMMAAIGLLLIALTIVWYGNVYKTLPQPSTFAMMAVDTHLRRLRGQLPLEIASDSPEKISSWFSGKISFALKLPNYQEVSGQEKLYNLEGARLVGFNNDYAAFVAYQMQHRPITLVVTSDKVAVPSGGEEIISKGLRFHYDVINELKVITWSDKGLTYALVSDLEERGQQSCMVCHTGTKDRDFIESLKPAKFKLK